jgi:SP family sugar:H+ symporter-like MFS transporter
MIFGYDKGKISGFLEMPEFLENFGDRGPNGQYAFSNWKSGLIVGLVSDLALKSILVSH